MDFHTVISSLSIIEEDPGVPRNVRMKIKDAHAVLEKSDSQSVVIAIDHVVHELENLAGDPNVSVYTRQQLWGLLSDLERLNSRPTNAAGRNVKL